MAKHQRASIVPFSSIVGSSVLLHDDTGMVVAQLGILGTAGHGADWKDGQMAVAQEVSKAINMHHDLVRVLEVIRDNESDRKKDGDPETMPPVIFERISRLVDAAKC